ncbi:hypothetical protein GP486_007226 [Trichoglossum hirsutum]|uniref:Uncharacterized protein n=1 Tax=Trichoglossum hirsutum TaxID=265104 RepID=A0A9P8IIE7_9PEZI|nr:hypothetical protein GP486_007226 [Trichoglossum hirsutum]
MQLSGNGGSERTPPTDRSAVNTQRDEDVPMEIVRAGPYRYVTNTGTSNRAPSRDGLTITPTALDEEDGGLGITDIIESQLRILAGAWPEVRRVYGRRTPPDAHATVQALMHVLDTVRSTLGLEPQTFYTRFANTVIPRDPACEDGSAIPITPSSQKVDLTWPGKDTPGDGAPHLQKESDTVVTQTDSSLDDPIITRAESKSGFSLDELQYRIRVETTATKKRLTCISGGPPSGGLTEGSLTSALDCCVVVGMFLGIRQHDVELAGNINDEDVPILYPPARWDKVTPTVAKSMKEDSFRRMLRYLNKDRSGDKLTHTSLLPVTEVFRALFKKAPQLTLRTKWKFHCSKCGVAEVLQEQLTFRPGANDTDLRAYFESMFEFNKFIACPRCPDQRVRKQEWIGGPPLNLCVIPPEHEGYVGITETPLVLNWVMEDGRYVRLTYRWAGGIYRRDNQFWVLWRYMGDQDSHTEDLSYDGSIHGGLFQWFNASRSDATRDRYIHDKPALIFFALVSAEDGRSRGPKTAGLVVSSETGGYSGKLMRKREQTEAVKISKTEYMTAKEQRKFQAPSTSVTKASTGAVKGQEKAAQPENEGARTREASVVVIDSLKGKGIVNGESDSVRYNKGISP